MLPVTEIFHSIQGEGLNAGRTAWFIRLFGCNYACPGCDEPLHEDSSKRTLMEEEAIVDQIKDTPADIIVITGGEPSMYDLTKLTALIREHCVSHSFGTDSVTIQVNWLPTQHPSLSRDHLVASPLICIETNGTCALKGEIDFVCVSPKPLSYRKGDGVTYDEGTFKRANEIKLVVGWTSAEELDNDIRSFTAMANEQTQILLSPLTTFPEGELDPAAAQAAVDACKRYQNIRLSPQWHKWIKIR